MPAAATPLDDWLRQLESYSPHEIDLGLERVESLLQRLDLQLPETVFHVAGTNGKGSSVAMLESILLASGALVGSYTSPHVERYNERMRIGGTEVGDAEIIAAFEDVEAARKEVPLTYFEFGTLAAVVLFAKAGVEIAILEVGMGGRLDAVNAIEPTAGLMTNIALDHCAWLGDTIDQIAIEKAGIMRAGKPIVFASPQRPVVIDGRAAACGAALIAAGRDYRWAIDEAGWSWRNALLQFEKLARPSLSGDIQVQNAAGVLALLAAAGFTELLQANTINAAMQSVQLPGRMQVIAVRWLLDVAHNPAAAGTLAAALDRGEAARTIALLGMLDDKDVEGTVRALDTRISHWIAVTADSPRAIPANELGRRVANATNSPCLIAENFDSAIERALQLADTADRILVTGSFHTVGPVLRRADSLYSRR